MEALHLLFNAITVIFIAATMFTAGLGTTLSALRGVFTNVPLPALALTANMVVIPLLGWGIGALFGLPSASFIALVLVASSPGGPFGTKLAMVQNGDITAAGAMQVLLAAIGSLTFAPTANAILTAAKVGKDVSLDVGTLVQTVALLQLVPFAIGLLLRRYAASTAQAWHPTAAAVSNVTFLIVLAGMLLGNWHDVVALLGSLTLLAGFVLATAAFAVGTLLATGPPVHRCGAPPWVVSPRCATRDLPWPRPESPSPTSPPSSAPWPESCSAAWRQPCRSPRCSAAGEAARETHERASAPGGRWCEVFLRPHGRSLHGACVVVVRASPRISCTSPPWGSPVAETYKGVETYKGYDAEFRAGVVRNVRADGKPIAQVARGSGSNEGAPVIFPGCRSAGV
ncbi:bile acid:sodium symporter family protein [Streptomyces celluloflavus]